jgi:hypothetical protein
MIHDAGRAGACAFPHPVAIDVVSSAKTMSPRRWLQMFAVSLCHMSTLRIAPRNPPVTR